MPFGHAFFIYLKLHKTKNIKQTKSIMKRFLKFLCLVAGAVLLINLCAFKKVDGPYIIVYARQKNYYIYKSQLDFVYGEGIFYGIDDFINRVKNETYLKPQDARLFYDQNKVKIIEESKGYSLCERDLYNDIMLSLSAGGGSVVAKYQTLYPKVLKNDLVGLDNLRASFTTYFNMDDTNRVHNICLSASKINNITLYPDEEFSFNNVVGERTEEKGYMPSKVIVDGKFDLGFGGGVCQVSTTLYNAVLLSGLTTICHNQHSLSVSYVEKSFDAMVSFGYADLVFKNTLNAPVLIVSKVFSNGITFQIYGQKMDYQISRKSVIKKQIPFETTTVFNEHLGLGEYNILQVGKDGFESEGYLVITKNGVRREVFLRKDQYKSVNQIIEVGK